VAALWATTEQDIQACPVGSSDFNTGNQSLGSSINWLRCQLWPSLCFYPHFTQSFRK